MFLSLVRPDRISSPITRSAAVTIPSLPTWASLLMCTPSRAALHGYRSIARCAWNASGRTFGGHATPTPPARDPPAALQALPGRCAARRRAPGHGRLSQHRLDVGAQRARLGGVALPER